MLSVQPEEFDLARFSRLLDAGKHALAAGDPKTAEAKLREALSLWRGPPLQDVAYEDFAQTEVARLDGLRIEAEEELVEAELARGQSRELVPKLETLIAAHPYRERLRGQVMLALYRAGRQTDALAAYQEARTLLLGKLGVEPNPALRRLQQAILNQDPALEAETPPAPFAPARSRRRPAAIGVLAAAAKASRPTCPRPSGSRSPSPGS